MQLPRIVIFSKASRQCFSCFSIQGKVAGFEKFGTFSWFMQGTCYEKRRQAMETARTAFVTFSWALKAFFVPQSVMRQKRCSSFLSFVGEKRGGWGLSPFLSYPSGEMPATGRRRLKRTSSRRPLSLRHDFLANSIALRFGNLQSAQNLIDRPPGLLDQTFGGMNYRLASSHPCSRPLTSTP